MFLGLWFIQFLRMILNVPGISLEPIPCNAIMLCWRETRTLLPTAIRLLMCLPPCTVGCVNYMLVRAFWMPGVPLDFCRWFLPNVSLHLQGSLGLIFAQN